MKKYKVANCLMNCKEECQNNKHKVIAATLFFIHGQKLLKQKNKDQDGKIYRD